MDVGLSVDGVCVGVDVGTNDGRGVGINVVPGLSVGGIDVGDAVVGIVIGFVVVGAEVIGKDVGIAVVREEIGFGVNGADVVGDVVGGTVTCNRREITAEGIFSSPSTPLIIPTDDVSPSHRPPATTNVHSL